MTHVIIQKPADRLELGDVVVFDDIDTEQLDADRANGRGLTDEVLLRPAAIAELHIVSYPGKDIPHVTARPGNRNWPARLVARRTERVAVHVDANEFPTPRGHGQRIKSHAPKKRGWYTDPNGYDVACSCGWSTDAVSASRGSARRVWLEHKAAVINELLAVNKHGYAAAFAVEAREYPWLRPRKWKLRMRQVSR